LAQIEKYGFGRRREGERANKAEQIGNNLSHHNPSPSFITTSDKELLIALLNGVLTMKRSAFERSHSACCCGNSKAETLLCIATAELQFPSVNPLNGNNNEL